MIRSYQLAYYENEDEDLNEQSSDQGGPVQTSAPSSMISGQGAAASGNTPQQTASNSPDKGSNFVGIHDYINANKNQADKLGNQVSGVIQNSADQAKGSINQLNQAADDQIKSTGMLNDDLSNKIANNPESLTQDERNTAKNTSKAQYSGPKDVTGFGDLYNNAQKNVNTAQSNINNSGTEQGRMGLISQVNNKPRTQGMNVFDNTLLQAGGGREKIAQAATANKGIGQEFDTAKQNIQNKIGRADDSTTTNIDESAGAIGETNKAQADAYSKIQNSLNNWKAGFQPKVKQAQDDLVAQQNRVSEDIQDISKLDPETLSLMGLNAGDRIYDLNLNDYLNSVSPSDINSSNIASAEDYARYAALADLAGEKDLYLNPQEIDKAGTAPKFSVNSDKLKLDTIKKQQDYQEAYRTELVPDMGPTIGMSGIAATPQNVEKYLMQMLQNIKNAAATDNTDLYNRTKDMYDYTQEKLDNWKRSKNAHKVVNPYKGMDVLPGMIT